MSSILLIAVTFITGQKHNFFPPLTNPLTNQRDSTIIKKHEVHRADAFTNAWDGSNHPSRTASPELRGYAIKLP